MKNKRRNHSHKLRKIPSHKLRKKIRSQMTVLMSMLMTSTLTSSMPWVKAQMRKRNLMMKLRMLTCKLRSHMPHRRSHPSLHLASALDRQPSHRASLSQDHPRRAPASLLADKRHHLHLRPHEEFQLGRDLSFNHRQFKHHHHQRSQLQ